MLARIEVFRDLAAAELPWNELAKSNALTTPYQRFEWAAQWHRHVGVASQAAPLIVVGFDGSDTPQFILPLILERRYGAGIAAFFGGSHSNLNMPVFAASAAADLTPDRLNRMLREIAPAHGVDLFALTGQPPLWQGVANPLAALPFQRSADDVYFGTLSPERPMPPRLPSGMRKKERQLRRMPGFRYSVATTAAEVDRILAFFRAHKAVRFGTHGIHNVFEDRGVMNFITDACHDGLAAGRPVIELHALEAGGDVLAIIGGVQDRTRFSVMFNSITTSPYARKSPRHHPHLARHRPLRGARAHELRPRCRPCRLQDAFLHGRGAAFRLLRAVLAARTRIGGGISRRQRRQAAAQDQRHVDERPRGDPPPRPGLSRAPRWSTSSSASSRREAP